MQKWPHLHYSGHRHILRDFLCLQIPILFSSHTRRANNSVFLYVKSIKIRSLLLIYNKIIINMIGNKNPRDKNNQILIKFKFISYKVSVSVSGNAISSTKISFLKYSSRTKHVKVHSCVFLRVSQVQKNKYLNNFFLCVINNARIFLIFGLRFVGATSVTMENFRQLINSVARQNIFLNDFHCFLIFKFQDGMDRIKIKFSNVHIIFRRKLVCLWNGEWNWLEK